MAKKVLVLGEVREGSLRNVSFEAIAAAKTVAAGGEVVGVLIGESVRALGNEFIQYGADRVVVVENSKLAQYTSDGYAQAMLAVIKEKSRRNYFWSYSIRKRPFTKIGCKIRFWFNI